MDHVKSLVLKHSCGDLICLNEFGSNSLEKVRVWLRTCSVSQQAAVIQEFPTGCEVFLNDHFQHAKHWHGLALFSSIFKIQPLASQSRLTAFKEMAMYWHLLNFNTNQPRILRLNHALRCIPPTNLHSSWWIWRRTSMNKGLEHQGKRRNLGKLIFLVADSPYLPE